MSTGRACRYGLKVLETGCKFYRPNHSLCGYGPWVGVCSVVRPGETNLEERKKMPEQLCHHELCTVAEACVFFKGPTQCTHPSIYSPWFGNCDIAARPLVVRGTYWPLLHPHYVSVIPPGRRTYEQLLLEYLNLKPRDMPSWMQGLAVEIEKERQCRS